MRLLLDTHAFLWFLGGSKELSALARSSIENVENAKFMSVKCGWFGLLLLAYGLGIAFF